MKTLDYTFTFKNLEEAGLLMFIRFFHNFVISLTTETMSKLMVLDLSCYIVDTDTVGSETFGRIWIRKIIRDPELGSFGSEMNDNLMKFIISRKCTTKSEFGSQKN